MKLNVRVQQSTKFIIKLNIGFYKPKNDQCDQCTSYKNSTKEEIDLLLFNEHIESKDMCRNCKDADKIKAKACDNFGAYTIDMEAVNSCPKAVSGEFYYVTRPSLPVIIYHVITLRQMKIFASCGTRHKQTVVRMKLDCVSYTF